MINFSTLINIKRIPQEPTDDLCTVRCLESIYHYYNLAKPTMYFVRELALADEMAYLPQLLRLMSRDGFKVIANISSTQIFDLTWKGYSTNKLASKVEERYHNILDSRWKRLAGEYLLYLKEGNEISQDVISVQYITEQLIQGKILLALVDNVIFHQRGRRYWNAENKTYNIDDIKGQSEGHGVIINGINSEGKIHVVDPSTIQYYSNDGCYWLDPSVLIAGVYSHSGEIGIISR